jgi:hypothetical protein
VKGAILHIEYKYVGGRVMVMEAACRECPNFCVRGGLLNSSLLDVR